MSLFLLLILFLFYLPNFIHYRNHTGKIFLQCYIHIYLCTYVCMHSERKINKCSDVRLLGVFLSSWNLNRVLNMLALNSGSHVYVGISYISGNNFSRKYETVFLYFSFYLRALTCTKFL